jgi:hypothetical protein
MWRNFSTRQIVVWTNSPHDKLLSVPELPFSVHPKRPEINVLGVSKMALPVPEIENGDHFYRPNYPPKPRKNHLCNKFWPLESGILAILHILHILASFLECKST